MLCSNHCIPHLYLLMVELHNIFSYTIMFICMLLLWLMLLFREDLDVCASFTFDSCIDWGSTHKGNCTVITQDGPVGFESGNNVWIENGYLDYGNYWFGCPYKNNTCPQGFSFYGWIKFRAYPSNCVDYGVVVSTEIFNVHFLGNGHLAVYVWLPNGTEYYAESVTPIPLNTWYPIIVQFQRTPTTGNESWKLFVYAQNQLIGAAFVGQNRTYTPPNPNLLFGGSGNGQHTSIQLDSITFDASIPDMSVIYQNLLNVYLRQAYCAGKYGIQTNPLTCFWVESLPLNWTDAYSSCSKTAASYGYPFGRLARFPAWNESVWNEVSKRIAFYGNGSNGFNAWIGGGHQMHWLNANMNPAGVKAIAPAGMTFNSAGSTEASCLQINTQPHPWMWFEGACNMAQKYVCEMSYDCLLNNPCRNFGVCQPLNDGTNMCTCWPGTSGQFCEEGTPKISCRDNCTSCSSSAVFKIPNECESCLNKLKTFLNNQSQLEIELKLHLVSLNVDLEQAEMWQSHVLEEFDNVTKNAKKSYNIYDLPDCDMVWNMYVRSRLHDRIHRKFIHKITTVSSAALPAQATFFWGHVNQTEQELKNMNCFIDVTTNVKLSEEYDKHEQYTVDNHAADNEWLQRRFGVIAASGKTAAGLFYFGESQLNATSDVDNQKHNSSNQNAANQSANNLSQSGQNLNQNALIMNQFVTTHNPLNQGNSVTNEMQNQNGNKPESTTLHNSLNPVNNVINHNQNENEHFNNLVQQTSLNPNNLNGNLNQQTSTTRNPLSQTNEINVHSLNTNSALGNTNPNMIPNTTTHYSVNQATQQTTPHNPVNQINNNQNGNVNLQMTTHNPLNQVSTNANINGLNQISSSQNVNSNQQGATYSPLIPNINANLQVTTPHSPLSPNINANLQATTQFVQSNQMSNNSANFQQTTHNPLNLGS